MKFLGAAIGAGGGLSAACAQSYSGNADGRLHVWLMSVALGALLGAVTLPLFEQEGRRFSLGFLALFGFAVTCVAGTFVTFPVGASLGTLGGAIGGVVAGLLWRVRKLESNRWRPLVTTLVTMLVAGLAMYGWTNG